MIVFKFVLIMLAAVLVSNLISRIVPALSAPLVQIALGVAIALIPFGAFSFEFKLDPDLFFVLFIAPLIYYAGYTADKRTLWGMKGPIFGAAVVLVITTVIAVGCFAHYLVPAVPLAAAFALIGALGPTDDVAVIAISKRVAVPPKIMGILSGESIINDASGIVCFQFAIAALVTGNFSLKMASLQFVLLGIGGLLAGALLTSIKSLAIKKLRSLGMGNVTLRILIEVLTPFIIFMVAETLRVSGILAVFAAGITHSFMREKFNPETVQLHIAQDSVWEFLTFTLEGLVFVMLGVQLPGILMTAGSGAFPISGLSIVGLVLLLTLVLAVLRFLWWLVFVREKSYQEADSHIGAIKAALVFGLAGPRGTVTMASVMSIPLLLESGAAFPQRDLIVLLASGVIVVSMLVTNFVLPLLVGNKVGETKSAEEQAACSEIIQGVITRLRSEVTEENSYATDVVVRSYFRRNTAVRDIGPRRAETPVEKEFRTKVLLWEKENTAAFLESGCVDRTAAEHFLNVLDERVESVGRRRKTSYGKRALWALTHLVKLNHKNRALPQRSDFEAIISSNAQYVIEKLGDAKNEENAQVVDKLAAEFELLSVISRGRNHARDGASGSREEPAVLDVVARGFSIERELIQEMFEAGRISRETAKGMRADILTLETQLQSDG
ncbi:MAG: sodium:proton antiporter [Clostridiales bacterium]|nr:sodium:proton antiporter [Clostridiales bacterium]